MDEKDFLIQLQQQAAKQSLVHSKRLLPEQLDVFTSFIGRYPWQVILILSGFVAVLLEFAV